MRFSKTRNCSLDDQNSDAMSQLTEKHVFEPIISTIIKACSYGHSPFNQRGTGVNRLHFVQCHHRAELTQKAPVTKITADWCLCVSTATD